MDVDAGAQLDLLDLDDFLLLARFVLALLFFVFELAEIEDLANRRLSVGRNLNQIETGVGSHADGFPGRHDPHHAAVFAHKAHLRDIDLVIDARSIVAGRRGLLGRHPSYGRLLKAVKGLK